MAFSLRDANLMSTEGAEALHDSKKHPMPGTWLRRLIFGAPFETSHAAHTRLPNYLALPVFASDALSSVAYATEEILLVLVLAAAGGFAVLQHSLPIGFAI